jgi:uncharacterized membrane-anchored protein YhcB (DUF1043 family)
MERAVLIWLATFAVGLLLGLLVGFLLGRIKYIQDILARCHHHVTFDLRTKKTSDCDRSNRMPT